MTDDWLTEIWDEYMEECVLNPADGFDKVNLTLISTGDQKCEEFFNYDKICYCPFALSTPACELEETFVEYVQEVLCSEKVLDNGDSFFIGMNVLYSFWCLYLFLALGLTADAFFVPILTRMSDILGLDESVSGITLVALGNGAPDIFAAIASFTNSDPKVAKLAIGALLGAGMFVIMVVAAGCMLVVPFEPASWPLTRDIVTYLWAMFWLVQCMFKGKVELFDAIGFLVYYLVYVLVVVLWSKLGPKKHAAKVIDEVTNEKLEEEFARPRAGTNVSMVSGVSAVTPGLTGVAKNRIRAMSKSSQYELSIEGAMAPKGPSLKPPQQALSPLAMESRTSIQLSKRSSITEEVTLTSELWAALLPWDPEEFADGAMNKFFCILMSPLYLACKITVPIVAEDYSESWNYPLAIMQCLAYPFIFFALLKQYEGEPFGCSIQSDEDDCTGGLPRYCIPIIISVVLAIPTIAFGSLKEPPKGKLSWFYPALFIPMGFLSSILWIFVEANEVVGLLTALGVFWKIDSVIMGLTFLAWANSIGDFVADLSLARIGKARTAVAACFGSPLLNLLVGVGLGCTLAILTVDEHSNGVVLELDELSLCLAGGLGIMLVSLLFILPITNFKAGRVLGIYQIVFYCVNLGLCIYFGAF